MAKIFGNLLNEVEEIQEIVTKDDIVQQLYNLGLKRSMLVFLIPESQYLGYLNGGTQVFLEALMEVIGYDGTIVMPTFTLSLLDPACKSAMPIIREGWDMIRDTALAFDKKLTAPDQDDEMYHQFLRNEGVVRSYHPLYSFAAWGKYAKLICDRHPLHFGLSMESPLGKLSELNGYVLLAGANYKDCCMFQLAKYQGDQIPIQIHSAPIEENNKVVWKDMLDLPFDTSEFEQIGEIMQERGIVNHVYINTARCRFFSAREAVSLATAYFNIK